LSFKHCAVWFLYTHLLSLCSVAKIWIVFWSKQNLNCKEAIFHDHVYSLTVIYAMYSFSHRQLSFDFFFLFIVMMSPDLCVDSDVLEGPSRVSLNCPIRYTVLHFLWNRICCIMFQTLYVVKSYASKHICRGAILRLTRFQLYLLERTGYLENYSFPFWDTQLIFLRIYLVVNKKIPVHGWWWKKDKKIIMSSIHLNVMTMTALSLQSDVGPL